MGWISVLDAGTYQGSTAAAAQAVPNGAAAYIVSPQLAGTDITTPGLTLIIQGAISADGGNTYLVRDGGTWESGPGNIDGNSDPVDPTLYGQLTPQDGLPITHLQAVIDPVSPTSCSVLLGFYDGDGNLL